jgi:hypothetical protein
MLAVVEVVVLGMVLLEQEDLVDLVEVVLVEVDQGLQQELPELKTLVVAAVEVPEILVLPVVPVSSSSLTHHKYLKNHNVLQRTRTYIR